MAGRKKRPIKQAAIVSAFAKRLREIRAAKEMTQLDLAEKSDVTFTYVSRLEAGGATPGLDLMERLAKALGVELSELLPPTPLKSADSKRKQLTEQFQVLLHKSGDETLDMLGSLLARLAEASGSKR
jgi:transcriptional regulator with XRE-family HTH domain